MGAEDPAQSPADCACRLTGNNQVNAVGPRVFENIRPVCRDQKGTHGGLHFKSRALTIFAFTKCPIPPDHRQAGERGAIHPWLPGCWSWRLLVKPCPLLVIKNEFVEKYRGYRRFDKSNMVHHDGELGGRLQARPALANPRGERSDTQPVRLSEKAKSMLGGSLRLLYK